MRQDSRRHPRAAPGARVRLGFTYGGQRFSGLPMVALGAGGCSFVAPEPLLVLMDVLERSAPVEHLVLESEGLPHQPVSARLLYTMGRDPVLVGLEFVDVPEAFREALAALVESLLHMHPGH